MSLATGRERFDRADAWLKSLIRPDGGDWSLTGQPWEEKLRRHRARQASTLDFLRFIGSPHRGLRSVVVVGTAGKGTVTNMIATLLRSTGASVADHTSPYLQVPMEKMRLDGTPISGIEFAECVDELRGHYDRWRAAGHDLRYGQAWAALVMLWMAHSGADWCVYEASVGGRYSNAALLEPDVAVLTNVGLDHIETLGPSLEQIAWHKAGIAERASHIVTTERSELGLAQLEVECRAHGRGLKLGEWCRDPEDGKVSVRVGARWVPIGSDVVDHEAANVAAASAAVHLLSDLHGFEFKTDSVGSLVNSETLPGRFEVVSSSPRVVLDGAHNEAKVRALVSQFRREFPGIRATVAFGALATKSPETLIRLLSPIADGFIALAPSVVGKPAAPAVEVARLVAVTSGLPTRTGVVPQAAITEWIAAADPSETLLVTGSMYLVGEARSLWHPIEDLV